MDQPPAKRLRQVQCNCVACHGRFRDIRTVKRHGQLSGASSQNNTNPSLDPNSPIDRDLNSPTNPCVDPSSNFRMNPALNSPLDPDTDSADPDLNPSTNPQQVPVPDASDRMTALVPGLDTSLTDSTFATLPDSVVLYVLEELRIKLVRGHSRTDLEEHLQNAAKLNPQVPTEWSVVLKLLKKLGYKCPMHYKVCVQPDHTFLLK